MSREQLYPLTFEQLEAYGSVYADLAFGDEPEALLTSPDLVVAADAALSDAKKQKHIEVQLPDWKPSLSDVPTQTEDEYVRELPRLATPLGTVTFEASPAAQKVYDIYAKVDDWVEDKINVPLYGLATIAILAAHFAPVIHDVGEDVVAPAVQQVVMERIFAPDRMDCYNSMAAGNVSDFCATALGSFISGQPGSVDFEKVMAENDHVGYGRQQDLGHA